MVNIARQELLSTVSGSRSATTEERELAVASAGAGTDPALYQAQLTFTIPAGAIVLPATSETVVASATVPNAPNLGSASVIAIYHLQGTPPPLPATCYITGAFSGASTFQLRIANDATQSTYTLTQPLVIVAYIGWRVRYLGI